MLVQVPDAPAYRSYYPSTSTCGTLTYRDVASAVDLLAWHYQKNNQIRNTDVDKTEVVAVLTEPGIWSFLTELALIKAGYTPLLLSTNNSVPAIAHLINATGAKTVLHCDKYADVMAEAVETVKREHGVELKVVEQFVFDPNIKLESPPFEPSFTPEQEENRPAVILHSSGSTGFPKPVSISHAALLASSARFHPSSAMSTLPSFHTFGHGCLVANMLYGDVLSVWPRHVPFSIANVISFYNDIPEPPRQLYTVPYILELLSETEEGVEILKTFDAVWYGGAPLSQEVGDKLEGAGAHVASGFGMTEVGCLFWADRDFSTDHDWNWLHVPGDVTPHIRMEPVGDAYNLVVLPGWKGLNASNRPTGEYDTKDLFIRHSTDPHKIKYLGRMDDTLTQTLGEKTNPVPIERTIKTSPLVDEAIVFGDKRDQCGVLVIKAKDAPEDDDKYINAIWPAVEEANSECPSHSRIDKQMIRPLPHGTEVPRTPKLTVIRLQAYRKFADIIGDTYKRLQGSEEEKARITDPAEMLELVRNIILATLGDRGRGVTDDDDLFAAGIDSLKATKVSNALIRKLDLGDHKLSQNIVYDYPSISKLAKHLVSVSTGGADDASDTGKQMTDMVSRWVAKIAKPAPVTDTTSGPEKEVIVLTGATGSLGAHILADLSARDDVGRVICLARATNHEDARKRVLMSLAQRGRTAPESKFIAYAFDDTKDNLGLNEEEYDSLRLETTAVMHIAWPVNFRLGVGSFDAHVGGMVHLLNLTMASPRKSKPSYYVASSVSAVIGDPTLGDDGKIVEDFPTRTDSPIMGYGQSKWVTEKIVEAAGPLGARATVLRIGQLAANQSRGNYLWNPTEAYPLMFRSANVLGVLPDLNETPSWLPVDLCSGGAVDVVMRTNRSGADVDVAPHARLYHLVNPELAKWRTILEGLRKGGLKFETVSGEEWWDRLAKSNPDVSVNPTYKLLEFYQKEVDLSTQGIKAPEFSTKVTATVSPTIANSHAVDAETVSRWVGAWAECGFIEIEKSS